MQLIQFALQDVCAIAKVASKPLSQFTCGFCVHFLLRKLDYDFNWLVRGDFAPPADNVFFYFFIEVLLAERERVKGMEELVNLIDAKLNRLRCSIIVISPQRRASFTVGFLISKQT